MQEKQLNGCGGTFVRQLMLILVRHPYYLRYKFIKYMRLCNYYETGLLHYWYFRKKNHIGNLLGYEIHGENIGPYLTLFHNGPIVINRKAILGSYCKLHGDNCIGNNGVTEDCPEIGDNVDIGVGAKILGNVHIADNIKIGGGPLWYPTSSKKVLQLEGYLRKKFRKSRGKSSCIRKDNNGSFIIFAFGKKVGVI